MIRRLLVAALAVAVLAGCAPTTEQDPTALAREQGSKVDVDTPQLREIKADAGIADCTPGTATKVDDGLPETLEDYFDRDGISYLKIKVAGRLEEDVARLEAIAALLDRRERAFHISLDGNEQYADPDDFLALIARIKAAPALARFSAQIMYVEQPLDRAVALDPAVKPALAALPTFPDGHVDGVLVHGCYLFLECELDRFVDVDDASLVIGRIVAASARAAG